MQIWLFLRDMVKVCVVKKLRAYNQKRPPHQKPDHFGQLASVYHGWQEKSVSQMGFPVWIDETVPEGENLSIWSGHPDKFRLTYMSTGDKGFFLETNSRYNKNRLSWTNILICLRNYETKDHRTSNPRVIMAVSSLSIISCEPKPRPKTRPKLAPLVLPWFYSGLPLVS